MDLGFPGTLNEAQVASSEKVPTNLRRSCEACRASKGRCCQSNDDPRRCQRCLRDGKQCVFLETKPRPKRTKTSRTRVAEMEQKIDGLFALLQSGSRTGASRDLNLPDTPSSTPPPFRENSGSATYQRPQIKPADTFEPLIPVSSSWPKFDQMQDVISKGIIGFEKAERMLRDYGTYKPSFPFIIFDPPASLDSLRCDKPFLLLSILTMSASKNIQLQERLEAEVRETLARRVIVNCERSLDLLQGLLIYLSWYHRYFKPERQQIYQLSQMVISMAVDLQITRPGGVLPGIIGPYSFADCRDNSMGAQNIPSELEAMRTFLGCYYMSSCFSVAFRKPTNLKYTDYVDKCCQALADANETPSDQFLSYYIQLQRLAQDVNNTFDYGHFQDLPEMDALRTEMLIAGFSKRLHQFEDSFPAEVWKIVSIRMAFLHIKIYINEIGLHAARPDDHDSTSSKTRPHEWYFSMSRTDALITCVESTKKYLDEYLALSKDEFCENTMMEEIKLVYSVLILGKFTSGVDSPFLDATYLRDMANLGYYMGRLIDGLGEVITFNSNGREQIDYFWHFRRIFQHTRNWYEQQIRGGYFTTLEMNGLPECLDLSFMEILQMEPDPQYADDNGRGPVEPAAEDELWTVAMLEAWPTSTLDPRTISFNGDFQ